MTPFSGNTVLQEATENDTAHRTLERVRKQQLSLVIRIFCIESDTLDSTLEFKLLSDS